jgi:hypothetical protein
MAGHARALIHSIAGRTGAIELSSAQDRTGGFSRLSPCRCTFPAALFLSKKRRKTCGFRSSADVARQVIGKPQRNRSPCPGEHCSQPASIGAFVAAQ